MCDNLRGVHLVEADVEADGSRHEEVVVCAYDSSERSVLLLLVYEHLVEASFVALDIHTLAYNLDEVGDDHRLGGHVGVESVFLWYLVDDILLGLAACVEVVVHVLDLVEDEVRLVAVYVAFAVVSLHGVGLDDKEAVVVECCHLCCLPCEEVDVDMSVPLRYYYRLAAVDHVEAVVYHDDGPVGL